MTVRLREVASRWWPIGAALAVVALAAGIAVAGARDERLQASPGDVVAGYVSLSELTTHTIRLPYGAVEVGVTDPDPDPDDGDVEGRTAPDGGSWVGLNVDPYSSDSLPQPATVADSRLPQPAVVVELVADGRSYVVPRDPLSAAGPDRYATQRRGWVAVAGRPKDIRVAITYDGVRQTVRPSDGARTTGRAAPLYDLATGPVLPSSERPPPCSTPRYPAGFGPVRPDLPVTCDLIAYPPLPYLPQLGWAPNGSRWLAFHIGLDSYPSVDVDAAGAAPVEYGTFRTPEARVTLDGTPAVAGRATAPTLLDGGGADPDLLAVFRVPAAATPHRLDIVATWQDLDTQDGPPPAGAPVAPDLTVTWTKDVR